MSWKDTFLKLAQYNPPVYMANIAARKAAQEVIGRESQKAIDDCGHAKAMLYQLGVGGWKKFHEEAGYPNFNATNCREAQAAYLAYLDWLKAEKLPKPSGAGIVDLVATGGNKEGMSEFIDATTGTGTNIVLKPPPMKLPSFPDIPGLPGIGWMKWLIPVIIILVVIMVFMVILGKSGLGPAVGSHLMKK